MRIGTRVTVATALSVTLALSIFAAFAVRARDDARRLAAEGETRTAALALRTTLEALGPDARRVDPGRLEKELVRALGRTGTGWRVALTSTPARASNPAAPGPSADQLRRLESLANQPAVIERRGDDLIVALPIRAGAAGVPTVIGMLEVAHTLPTAPTGAPPTPDPATVIEPEARAVALAMRATVEAIGMDLTRADLPAVARAIGAELAATGPDWRTAIIPSPRTVAPPRPPLESAQLRRLSALSTAPELVLLERDGGALVAALPVRAVGLTGVEVIAMIEVARPIDHLDAARTSDILRGFGWVVVIAALATTAVFLLTRSVMTRPMAKLLAGVDEVARGDLSHVLLSERDDEIGAIATRFNDMTFTLRESRAETRRSADAKLALEQRLAHTEKLATIGQIAAEIAHEVGTPLGVIAGRARATQKKATDVEAVVKNAGIIAEQTARITRIIQRLLDFARRRVGPPGMSKVSLNELSLTTMELLGAQFAAGKIKTRLIRAEALPLVKADSDRIQQVLLNLIINAIQAMPDGGAIAVETSTVSRQRPGLELDPEHTFVRVEVSDTGPGIPRDRRDKIFEPFYTSKDGQGGTGLGLAVCAGIVKEHDGWIEVDDAATGGAVFRVFLPALAAERAGGERARTESGPPT